MKKRFKMDRGHSRHHFTKHGSRTHMFNMPRGIPMRGGIRM